MAEPVNAGKSAEPVEPVDKSAAEPPEPVVDSDADKWDEEAAKRKFERMREDLTKAQSERDALKPAAAEAEKRRLADLSEAQRLTEEKAAVEKERDALRATNIRREAADEVNLPAKYVKYITATDPAEALAQAKELAADFVKEPKAPDLRQGPRGTPNSGGGIEKNDLLRRMGEQ